MIEKQNLIEDLENQIKDKDIEMKKTIEKIWEETKIREMHIENAVVQKMRRDFLNTIHSQTIGSKVDFNFDSELVIDLSNIKGKKTYKMIDFKHFIN